MNINELKTFLAIIETGSLVRASQNLNVTQSTVTARLKVLEDELGQTLINRHKSGATLTPAGVRLERYALTISDLWGQARQETALPDGMNGICNIACEPDLWPVLGERFFGYLRQNCPEVAISVWLGNQSEIADWMAGGKSDIAFTYRSAMGAREKQIELPADTLILVSTLPNSPMRFDPNYVFVEAGETFGREHAAAYADADTARLSFNSAQIGLQHLKTSGGSAYLPMRLVEHELQKGKLFKISQAPEFKRRIYLTANTAALDAWDWFENCLSYVTTKSEINEN